MSQNIEDAKLCSEIVADGTFVLKLPNYGLMTDQMSMLSLVALSTIVETTAVTRAVFVPKGPGDVKSDMVSCLCELEWIPTLTSRFVRVILASMTAMPHASTVPTLSYSSSKRLSL